MENTILKYLNDSISETELEELRIWLQKPENQTVFKSYVRANHELNSQTDEFDAEAAYKKVFKKIGKKPNYTKYLKYVAIFIGVGILGYGAFEKYGSTETIEVAPQITLELEDGTIKVLQNDQSTVIANATGQKVTEQKNNELVYTDTSSEKIKYNTLKVPYGKTFGLTLSDGSKVNLNAGSELKYPVTFIKNEKNRNVYLNGEAYFQVAKNENHPFVVNTEDMDVEVLGTQFNVTSYTEDDKTYTVLVEGKVAAHNKLNENDTKLLNPNNKVYFDGNQLKTENVNVKKYVAWVTGELVFIDDSFGVIKNKLERKYNVVINNSYKALDEIIITATFKNETLDQVLKTFQTYTAFDYSIENNVVSINAPK